jgi:hypothetical protein
MKPQNYKVKDLEVKNKFIKYRRNKDPKNIKRLNLSWSNPPNPGVLDELVKKTASYFYAREEEIFKASDEDLVKEY